MTATETKVTRRCGLGGTDIAAIIGEHPNKSAWDVWAEKTGLLDDVISVTSARAEWGKRLQRVIAEAYTEYTGRAHRWIDETRHGVASFQIWTPDAECIHEPRGIDCKTAGLDQHHKWGQPGEGDDAVPAHVQAQAHWYLIADPSKEAWDIALLMAGSDFRIYEIRRDIEIEGVLLEQGERFWIDNVLAGVAPEPKDTEAAREYLRKAFPKNFGNIREATEEESLLLVRYGIARDNYDLAKGQRDDLETALKMLVGDADGIGNGVCRFTWKRTKDTRGPDYEAMAHWLAGQEDWRALCARFDAVLRQGSRRIHWSQT